MLWKRRKRPIRKQSFLLFELLLSMGLLMLCLIPLVKTHVGLARAEMKEILALRQDQKIEKALCDVKIALYEQKISWKELMKKKVKKETYTLEKLDKSTKRNTESLIVLGVTLHIGEKNYERTLYVKKALSHPH